jgi:DNA polymerase III subunit delta'
VREMSEMSFSNIISKTKGNEDLIRRIRSAIRSRKLFHGYIIEGKKTETKLLAEAIAAAALCEKHDGDACGRCTSCLKLKSGNSEDVIHVGSEDETVKVEDIQGLIERLSQKSYTGNRLFVIIDNGDRIRIEAQNKLLKTLEEPPTGVTIIIRAEKSESLVQTIRSRCQLLRMFSDGMQHPGGLKSTKSQEAFQQTAVDTALDIILGKPVYNIWKKIEKFTSDRDKAARFVSISESFYRDLLVSSYEPAGSAQSLILNKENSMLIEENKERFTAEQLFTAIQAAERASKDIAQNVSHKRAVKYMIFDIQEKLNGNSNRSKI